MRFHPLSVLSVTSVFTIGPLSGLAAPFASRWDNVHPKHTWGSVPENWVNLGHPPADTTIDLHIALKAQHENALIDALYEVSSPGRPKCVLSTLFRARSTHTRVPLPRGRYGAHLSKEQVAQLVAPPPDVLDLVHAWLEHHGVLPSTVSTKHGGSLLTLIGVPVSRANDLLSASYRLYQHIGTNETVLRTLSYGLPATLLAHVQTVVPTTHFGFPPTSWQKPLMRPGGAARAQAEVPAGEPGTVLSSRDEFVTPSFLRRLYKTSAYVPAAADRNVLGVAGYNNDYPSPDDLGLFMNQYRSDAISATFNPVQIKGGVNDPSNPTSEASLNIQYTEAIAYPTPHTFYSTGGGTKTQGDSFMNWLGYMLDQKSVPQTISTPYSAPEYTVTPDYAIRVCNMFAQLGARGASLLFSSGNDGVGRGNCQFKDDSGNTHVWFLPTFPSTCTFNSACRNRRWYRSLTTLSTIFAGPFVTSVGGTTGNPEEAAVVSGGGFSTYFPRQPYQGKVVSTFLKNLGNQYDGLYKCVCYRDPT